MFFNDTNRKQLLDSIESSRLRSEEKKTLKARHADIDNASRTLLQMDEDAAAKHLSDNNWLGSMKILPDMLDELKEVNAFQRQSALRKEKKTQNEKEFTWFDKVLTANVKDPMEALRLVQSREDIDPELRSSVVSAIQSGRIDTIDDPATMFALQDRIFGDNPDVESGEFAIEIGKGNLKINTFKELFEMQKNLNKGEKNLVRKALHILDASFEGDEDFTANPNRLAARNMYLKSLTKAITENNTKELVLLTNKEHVQSVGQSFKGVGDIGGLPAENAQGEPQNEPQNESFISKISNIFQNPFGTNSVAHASPSVDTMDDNATKPDPLTKANESNNQHLSQEALDPTPKKQHPPTQADKKQVEEEGIMLMERPMVGLEGLHNGDVEDSYGFVRHEQFISPNGYNFGKFKDGGIREDDPNLLSQYIQRDTRVFKRKFIDMARKEYDEKAKAGDEYIEFMGNKFLVDSSEDYNIVYKNCVTYVNVIISRAEELAEEAGESLEIK